MLGVTGHELAETLTRPASRCLVAERYAISVYLMVYIWRQSILPFDMAYREDEVMMHQSMVLHGLDAKDLQWKSHAPGLSACTRCMPMSEVLRPCGSNSPATGVLRSPQQESEQCRARLGSAGCCQMEGLLPDRRKSHRRICASRAGRNELKFQIIIIIETHNCKLVSVQVASIMVSKVIHAR